MIFGGLGRVPGAIVGGLLIGPMETLTGAYIGFALEDMPKLLLLDEPFAGMNPSETAQAAMVRRIRDLGLTILFVEHDMAAVMGLCDGIVVID